MSYLRFVLLAGAIALPACGNSSPVAPSTPATLNIMIKDAPFDDARAVLVTFSEVSVHTTGGAFTTVPFANNVTTRTCDLKQLARTTDILGTGGLTTGHYTQIRLVVASVTLYFDSPTSGPPCGAVLPVPQGRNSSVIVPSGEVRLNQEFDVTSTKATTIILDFDGTRSFNLMGNGEYMLSPVVTVVSVQ